MALPDGTSSYHTVWVTPPGRRAVAVRYATAAGHLYCLGDDELASVDDGTPVAASVHRIANGPPVLAFDATVRTVPPENVERESLLELVAHVPMGRSLAEVEHTLDAWQAHRRIIELVA